MPPPPPISALLLFNKSFSSHDHTFFLGPADTLTPQFLRTARASHNMSQSSGVEVKKSPNEVFRRSRTACLWFRCFTQSASGHFPQVRSVHESP